LKRGLPRWWGGAFATDGGMHPGKKHKRGGGKKGRKTHGEHEWEQEIKPGVDWVNC